MRRPALGEQLMFDDDTLCNRATTAKAPPHLRERVARPGCGEVGAQGTLGSVNNAAGAPLRVG
jgi:hypothetical protein